MRYASRTRFAALWLAAQLVGCGSEVLVGDETGGGGDGWQLGRRRRGYGGGDAPCGMPCSYLYGQVDIAAWDETDAGYSQACYSFQFASHDVELTKNDWDILYYGDAFFVNTVVDDSFSIVDLGVVDLLDLPAGVDMDAYPVDAQGAHDGVAAQLGHTYWVRTEDGNSRLVVAFTVIAQDPAPGRRGRVGALLVQRRAGDSSRVLALTRVSSRCGG